MTNEEFEPVLTLVSDDERVYELGKPNHTGLREIRLTSPTDYTDGGKGRLLGSDPDPNQKEPREKKIKVGNCVYIRFGRWPLGGYTFITGPIQKISGS